MVDRGRFFGVERIISSREGQQVSLFFGKPTHAECRQKSVHLVIKRLCH